MMHDHGQSDSPVVPTKSPNKAGEPAAEGMEGRGLAKGNPRQQHAPRTQDRVGAPSALERVRQAAKRDKTGAVHDAPAPRLQRRPPAAAYFALKRDAAPGIDGETWQHYGEALEENLRDLSGRLARGAYRAKPVKRTYIAKADGRQRPLGIPTLEDKLVQRTTVEVLNAIYETDFLGFSYGFRPGRSPHQALDALYAGLLTRKVNWVLDLDIRGFFDAIDRGWLVKFVEHRIADRRVVRLIQKWLNAGVLEDGTRTWSETGTPQGGSISPLLANVYLHYAFDLWAHRWRKTQAHGDVIVVRYADDVIVGFQHRADAERFLAELRERFAKFGLELHPEKTRLLEFGPFAAENRQPRRQGEAGDVQLPRLHAYLREEAEWTVHGGEADDPGEVAGEAERGESRAAATHARPDSRGGRVAEDGRRRAPAVLRGAHEPASLVHVPFPGGPTVVPHAAAARAAQATHLGADAAAHSALAAPRAHYSSLSPEATWRCHLRQEPSAVIPLAGICGGGYEQSSVPTPTHPGSLDEPVSTLQDTGRNRELQRLGRLHVDRQLDLRVRLDRDPPGILAFEDLVHQAGRLAARCRRSPGRS